MAAKNYTRADLIQLAERIYEESGGKARLMERARNYGKVTPVSGPIHNYYYVHKDVFDYGDLDATLSRAAVFLDGGVNSRAAGADFAEILQCLADEGYLIDHTFCDKAFDGYTMQLLVHAWMIVNEDKSFAGICGDERKAKIEDWFYNRAKLMYRDRDAETWATYRPYDNQEIGVGGCVLLAALFRERDPELAAGLLEVADARHIGWETKNGNPDDTLFYTPIFAKVLYFYATYRPRPELLTLENCCQTFEGMLQQQSGAGIYTLYNWTQYGTAPEMMALGTRLFQDGRYKWMANRFLDERVEKRNRRMQYASRKLSPETLDTAITGENADELREIVAEELGRKERYDHVWEGLTDNIFHLWYFWDDSLAPQEPQSGSMVLEKSAGQGRWPYDPEPVLPDKLVMRGGWGENDLLALFNLWGGKNSPGARTVSHRYPGANELISLVCGEQFLVPNTDQATRDIYIHRGELNAFNLRRDGEWLSAPQVMYNPDGRTFGIYPTLESYNSELRFFESFPSADGAKLTMYEYYGWTSERTVLSKKGKYLAVFDQSFGPAEETGGVRWHLQGEVTKRTEQSMTLRLLDSTLRVLYPHKPEWLRAEENENNRAVTVYQHHADIDFDLVSTGQRMGSVTIFCPGDGEDFTAEVVDVTCSGHPAHPNAIGVRLCGGLIGSRLGMYRNEYDYDGFKTDAGAFLLEPEENGSRITFFDARTIRFAVPSFSRVEADAELAGMMEVTYRDGVIGIRFGCAVSGGIRVLG